MKKIRYIPYGYTIRNGNTIIEHKEADVIREIFEAYIQGASLKAIAEELTGRKIPYSEKTDIWDKARIARIIDNAKYIGDGEYDPIIDETIYETAVNLKTARQRNTFEKDCEAINLLRNYIQCGKCGAPMKRRVSSKHRVLEGWICTNDMCGFMVRISDAHLLEKVNVLMNRIICNTRLLIPRQKKRLEMSPAVLKLNNEICLELERDNPNEDLVISKTVSMASQMYRESEAKLNVAASIARKRAEMMTPQEELQIACFTDLISYIALNEAGKLTLHTKTDTEIGDDDSGSEEDS
ncbi:MAG: recombinase family protein [Oscillospiraceae bacterium]|nr:recombinase family protein [Oscillospiraceae bacterium]